MGPGDRRVNVLHHDQEERQLSTYCLNERLKCFNQSIEEQLGLTKLKERIPVMTQMIDQLQATINSLDDDMMDRVDELFSQHEAILVVLDKAKAEMEPYTCGICKDDLEPGKIILGKGCYHTHCLKCTTRTAIEMTRPSGLVRVDNSDYWVVSGTNEVAGRGEGGDPAQMVALIL